MIPGRDPWLAVGMLVVRGVVAVGMLAVGGMAAMGMLMVTVNKQCRDCGVW